MVVVASGAGAAAASSAVSWTPVWSPGGGSGVGSWDDDAVVSVLPVDADPEPAAVVVVVVAVAADDVVAVVVVVWGCGAGSACDAVVVAVVSSARAPVSVPDRDAGVGARPEEAGGDRPAEPRPADSRRLPAVSDRWGLTWGRTLGMGPSLGYKVVRRPERCAACHSRITRPGDCGE